MWRGGVDEEGEGWVWRGRGGWDSLASSHREK